MKSMQVAILVVVVTTVFLAYLNIWEVSNLLLPGGFLLRASLKRVDKHFFFELLSQYDPVVRRESYLTPLGIGNVASAKIAGVGGGGGGGGGNAAGAAGGGAVSGSLSTTAPTRYRPHFLSEFSDIVDRALLVRYLTERFAYTSFLQISCRTQRTYQLLEESKIVNKLCVDAKGGGTHTTDPIKFISDMVISRTNAALASSSSRSGGLRNGVGGSGSGSSGSQSASQDDRRYDVILVESKHLMLSITIMDSLLELLADGGVLILTDTTTFQSSWREVYLLRQRDNFDCATLDVDNGITIVAKRHNRTPLDLSRAGSSFGASIAGNSSSSSSSSSSSEFSVGATNAGGMLQGTNPSDNVPAVAGGEASSDSLFHFSGNPKALSFERFTAKMEHILNLVTFEDLHKWLAPTGNVDLLTAFGGRRGLDVYRESIEYRERCTALLAASHGTAIDKSISCFNEALTSGRLSLMGRWQLALLLMNKDKLVDAVTMLGELQGISPAFHKWIITETSLSFAAF